MSEPWQWPESADHRSRSMFIDRGWRSRSNLTLSNVRFSQGSGRHATAGDYLNFMAQFYNEQLNHMACNPSLMVYYYQSLMALSNWGSRNDDHNRLLYGSQRQLGSSFDRTNFYRSRQRRSNEAHVPFGEQRWRRESQRSNRSSWRRSHQIEEEDNDRRRSDTYLAFDRRQEDSQSQNDLGRTEFRGRTARKILPSTWPANDEPKQNEDDDSGSTVWRKPTSSSEESSFSTHYNPESNLTWTSLMRNDSPCFQPRSNATPSPSTEHDSGNVEDSINEDQQTSELVDVNETDAVYMDQNSDEALCSDEQTDTNATEMEVKQSSDLEPGNWFSQEEQQVIVNMFTEVDVRHEQQMMKNKQMEGEINKPLPKSCSPATQKEGAEREASSHVTNKNSPSGDFRHGEENSTITAQEESSSSEDGLVLIMPQSCSPSEKISEYAEVIPVDSSQLINEETLLVSDLEQENSDFRDWRKFCSGWGKAAESSLQTEDGYHSSTSKTSVSDTYWMPDSNQCVNENLSVELKQLLGIRTVTDGLQEDSSVTSNCEQYFSDLTLDDELELRMASMIVESPDVDIKPVIENRIFESQTNDDFNRHDEGQIFGEEYPNDFVHCFNSSPSQELNEIISKSPDFLGGPTSTTVTCDNDTTTDGFLAKRDCSSIDGKNHSTINSPQNSLSNSPEASGSQICQDIRSVLNAIVLQPRESESVPDTSTVKSNPGNINFETTKTCESSSVTSSFGMNSNNALSQRPKMSSSDEASEYLKKLLGVHQHDIKHKISHNHSNNNYSEEYDTHENVPKETMKSMSSTDILKSILGIPLTESIPASELSTEKPIQKNVGTNSSQIKIKSTKMIRNNDKEIITTRIPSVKKSDSDDKSVSFKEKYTTQKDIASDLSKEGHRRKTCSSQNSTRRNVDISKENENATQDSSNVSTKLPIDSNESSTCVKKRKPRRYKKSRNQELGPSGDRKDKTQTSPKASLQENVPEDNLQDTLKSTSCQNSTNGQTCVTTKEKSEVTESQKPNKGDKKQKWRKNWSRTRPDSNLQPINEQESENSGNKNDLKELGKHSDIPHGNARKTDFEQCVRLPNAFLKDKHAEKDTNDRRKSLPSETHSNSGNISRKDQIEVTQKESSTLTQDREPISTSSNPELPPKPKDLAKGNADETSHFNKNESNRESSRQKRWDQNRKFNQSERPIIRRRFERSYYYASEDKFYSSRQESKRKNLTEKQYFTKPASEKEDRRTKNLTVSVEDGKKAAEPKPPVTENSICNEGSKTKMDNDTVNICHTDTEVIKSIADEDLKSNEINHQEEKTKEDNTSKHDTSHPLLFHGQFGNHPLKWKAKTVSKTKFIFSFCDLNECKEFKRNLPVSSPKLPKPASGISAFELGLLKSLSPPESKFDLNIYQGTFGKCIPSVIEMSNITPKEGNI